MTMSSTPGPLRRARPEVRAQAAWPELGWLARIGLVTRGIVYGVIAVLALEVAFRSGGKTASQRGALETIAHQSFGQVLLVVVAVGLACYAIWRLLSAVFGAPGKDGRSGLKRLSALGSGLAYGAVCVTAVKILSGTSTTGGTNSPKHDAAGVLGWTAGPVIVAVVGLILVGVAVYQGYKGLARNFLEDSKTGEMTPGIKRAFTMLGVWGHLARAVVFVLVGYGLVKAAIDYSPHSAIGLDGALQKLSRASYGPLLLGIVAAGLLSFALYSVADARYRKV
jgi:hypothetical protein